MMNVKVKVYNGVKYGATSEKLCGGNFMQINLSEETIKTVYKALKSEKNTLNGMLRRIEVGTAAKEKKEIFEQQLAEVEDALQIFEE